MKSERIELGETTEWNCDRTSKQAYFMTYCHRSLFHFASIPFTHDEFSTLFRLNFDSDIDLHPNSIQFKCFVWNKGHQVFLIDDFTISLRSGNPIIYGLYEPIPTEYNFDN